MKRIPLRRKPKRHINEAPGAMERERAYPYCRICGAWVGIGGEVHHEPPKKMGGTIHVYTDVQTDPFHLEKRCGPLDGTCHSHGEVRITGEQPMWSEK